MNVERIELHNFRNFENLELSFDSSRNVLIGENAQGKTNLIEAIYICAFARSFRTQNSSDLIRIGETRASVSLDLISDDFAKNITIILDRSGKKMIKKDGKVVKRTADLLNNLVVMVFSPEDLRIIKDSPEKRRNFVNKELSQIRPRYYECIRMYRDALHQKNSMLKDAYRNNNLNEDMLDIYDLQLAKYGAEIVKYRKNFIHLLSERANEVQKSITGGKEELQIKYLCSMSEENAYDELISRRDRDIYSGHSSIGPQRDDLEFYINGKNARKYGSQGQQRTVALALKLAEIGIARDVIGENPVLLLDDVLSELDEERQTYLFRQIEDVQLFITTTDSHSGVLQKMMKGNVYTIQSGTVIESTEKTLKN